MSEESVNDYENNNEEEAENAIDDEVSSEMNTDVDDYLNNSEEEAENAVDDAMNKK
jgi:hypothetical protein